MYLPCAQVGTQLSTFSTPPPKAADRQLVQCSWASSSFAVQPMS